MMTITYGGVRAHITHARPETKTSAVSMVLQPGAVMSLKPTKQGMKIYSGSGALWLTQEGDATDYFLAAGDTFQSTQRGLLVLQAMEEATVSIME